MLTFTTGDLLDAEVDAIVNTVNTVGVMGKGLALQFKRRHPANYAEYRKACELGEVKLGRMFVTRLDEIAGPAWIVNFPTKGHWKSNSKLSDIEEGLVDLVRFIREKDIHAIAVPPLGAGNGGLEWSAVRTVIERSLGGLDDVDIQVFEPSSAVRPLAPKPVRMTRSRALIVEILVAYIKRRQAVEPWESASAASALEVQKLMYFAEQVQPELNLKFVQGHYGPYSDVLRIMLSEMEGWYVVGNGDATNRTLDLAPVTPTKRAVEDAQRFKDPAGDTEVIRSTVECVMKRIEGFEGPYPLELLASVKWASDRTGSSDAQTVSGFIRSWNVRKGRIFTPNHVSAALSRLAG